MAVDVPAEQLTIEALVRDLTTDHLRLALAIVERLAAIALDNGANSLEVSVLREYARALRK